ncbi:hypothetical protein A5707_03680 [Mycobacterium kyorinense]|uniref:Transmembrane protein n=1 Tax=Mycobacterium kyorinense TaxID=487514 RepID=A0A1A2Z1X4_9MYCO|nr:hypothetical protein [Mycobacterium kyorinense]OBI44290.1 hypothetical protein A5707_03680 [Mycobacterium kyorinense]
MLIAGVLCVGAATVCAALGLWSLSRPAASDASRQLARSVAPTQLAAAVMLAAGGAAALVAPRHAAVLAVLGMCIVGALGTIVAGSWQSARYALRRDAAPAGCSGVCATCTLGADARPCH